MSNYTPSEIAKMIKEGTWKDVQEFDVLDFLNEKYVYNDTGRSGYTFINRSSQETETLTKHYGEVGVHTWEEYHIRPDYYSTPREIQIGFSIELNNAK